MLLLRLAFPKSKSEIRDYISCFSWLFTKDSVAWKKRVFIALSGSGWPQCGVGSNSRATACATHTAGTVLTPSFKAQLWNPARQVALPASKMWIHLLLSIVNGSWGVFWRHPSPLGSPKLKGETLDSSYSPLSMGLDPGFQLINQMIPSHPHFLLEK